jgi:hypothetical protein
MRPLSDVTENFQGYKISVHLPVCAVASFAKIMVKYHGIDLGCNANPYSHYILSIWARKSKKSKVVPVLN